MFFNQEIIKDLDKKNEYLFIFNIKELGKQNEITQILLQERKKEAENRLPIISFFYFLIIRQVFRFRQRQIGRSYL